MKNIYLKGVLALFLSCLSVGFFLSFINSKTKPVIENKKIENVIESLQEVLPDAKRDDLTVLEKSDLPTTVSGIYKDNASGDFAVTLETSSSYSKSPLLFTVGISADGTIKKIVLVNYAETRDVGQKFLESFVGKDESLSGVDTVAGVTYSSTTIKNAVLDAYTAVKE